jgi:hypothetical protein
MRAVKGQTILVTHDTNLPRPYSRKYVLQGTRGIVEGHPRRVYVEGMSPREHQWDPIDGWFAEHDHPLWRSERVGQAGRGHGGMDWIGLAAGAVPAEPVGDRPGRLRRRGVERRRRADRAVGGCPEPPGQPARLLPRTLAPSLPISAWPRRIRAARPGGGPGSGQGRSPGAHTRRSNSGILAVATWITKLASCGRQPETRCCYDVLLRCPTNRRSRRGAQGDHPVSSRLESGRDQKSPGPAQAAQFTRRTIGVDRLRSAE